MKTRTIIIISLFTLCSVYSKATPHAEVYSMVFSNSQTDSLPITCSNSIEIERIIDDAISLGAPIYNEGLHLACYRIYEWASYKIIYVYGKTCKNVEAVLKTAIDKSHGDFSDTEKAWIMRSAFDKILGVPTKTTTPEGESLQKNG
ncbi:MAG: hypothetical protein ABI683_10770 [Ginsengibacter sp.]